MFKNKNFWKITLSNFFGVLNDNAFKQVIIFVLITQVGHSEAKALSYNTLVSFIFFLPFIIFTTFSGKVANKFSKSKIIKWVKLLEIFIMVLGAIAITYDITILALVLLFLMAVQSAFYSPCFYGVLPQLFSRNNLSEANGKMSFFHFIAIIFGTGIAGVLSDHQSWLWCLPIFSIIGFVIAKQLPDTQREGDQVGKMSFFASFKKLKESKLISMAVVDALFYSMGIVILAIVFNFAKFEFELTSTESSLYVVCFALGTGLGALLVGLLSRLYVNLGYTAFGAIAYLILCFFYQHEIENLLYSKLLLFSLGVSAGFMIVPIKAYFQAKAPSEHRGILIAISNFISFSAMAIISLLIYVLSNNKIIEGTDSLFPFIYVAVSVIILIMFINYFFFIGKILLNYFIRIFYKIKISNSTNIPVEGGALLLPNHTTFLDGIFISIACPRKVHFLMDSYYFKNRVLGKLFTILGFVPINTRQRLKKDDLIKVFSQTQKLLREGKIVCIFPEGELTRNGFINRIKKGFLHSFNKKDTINIIPCYLGSIWGSIFSKKAGEKFSFKFPKGRFKVSVMFGKSLDQKTISTYVVEKSLKEFEYEFFKQEVKKRQPLHSIFLDHLKYTPFRKRFKNTEDKNFTFNFKLLLSIFTIRQIILENTKKEDKYIGLLLPNHTSTVSLGVATLMTDKIPIYLNFSLGSEQLAQVIETATIQTIFTSKKLIDKLGISLPKNKKIIFAEDLKSSITSKKIFKAFSFLLLPNFLIKRLAFPKTYKRVSNVATIIFSSGSSGKSKGVMLSHANLLSNIDSCLAVVPNTKHGRILASMPLFHSFGFLTSFAVALAENFMMVYHNSPIDFKGIAKSIRKNEINLILGSPSFLALYAKAIKKEHCESLKCIISGGEKLSASTEKFVYEKMGLYICQGYGATELSPVTTLNIPEKHWDIGTKQCTKGSAGKALPGVQVKIVSVETGEELGYDQEGTLWVKGSNVMQGYFNNEKQTKEVLSKDGWYNTQDIAKQDENGYIYLTGRLSRFSKIGGEMVPQEGIEDELNKLFLSEEKQFVVLGKDCPDKGEKLIVYTTIKDLDSKDVTQKLRENNVPNIWIPKEDNFLFIKEFPLLSIGKIDVVSLKKLLK